MLGGALGWGIPHPVVPVGPLAPAQPLHDVVQKALERDVLTEEVARVRLQNVLLEERAAVAEHKLCEAGVQRTLQHQHHHLLPQPPTPTPLPTALVSTPLPASPPTQHNTTTITPQQQQHQHQPSLSGTAVHTTGTPIKPSNMPQETLQASSTSHHMPMQPQQQQQQQQQQQTYHAQSVSPVQGHSSHIHSPDARQRSGSPAREVEAVARRMLSEAKEDNTRFRDEMKQYVRDTLSDLQHDRQSRREEQQPTYRREPSEPYTHRHRPQSPQLFLDEVAKQATQAEVLAERRKGLLEVKEVEMLRLRQEVHKVEAELQTMLRRNAVLEGEVSRLEALSRQNADEQDRLRRQRAAADADSEAARKKHLEGDVDIVKLRDRLTHEERQHRQQQDDMRTLIRDLTTKLEQTESRLITTTEQLQSKTAEAAKSVLQHEADLKDFISRPKRADFDTLLRQKGDLQGRFDTAAVRLAEHERELSELRTLLFPLLPASVQLLPSDGEAGVPLSRRIREVAERSEPLNINSNTGIDEIHRLLLLQGQQGTAHSTLSQLLGQNENTGLMSLLSEFSKGGNDILTQLMLGKRDNNGTSGILLLLVQQLRTEVDAKKARIAELETENGVLRQKNGILTEESGEGLAAAAKRLRDVHDDRSHAVEQGDKLRAEIKRLEVELSDKNIEIRRLRTELEDGSRLRDSDSQRTIDTLTRDKSRLVERLHAQETLQEELLRQLKSAMSDPTAAQAMEFEQRRFELQKVADDLKRPATEPPPAGVGGSMSMVGMGAGIPRATGNTFLASLRGPRSTPPAPF